ncbi:MAG TPA: glycosyltransferase family 10 [Candidatus Paceibacterota bacterium]|nr:glycosyltransferase family 10 [Candidatus Paceibacterota bacterium]HMO82765.1 glycosyltransferase family 10 [Candidatus Paceibacterota bacterium]
MKKIRVKFLKYGHSDHTTPGTYAYFFHAILSKYYTVEISETPDYIFYHESTDEHLKYDCVKIFYTGENVSPNFNLCDYAIGFDWLDFGERYYRFPIYLNSIFYRPEELLQTVNTDWTKQLQLTPDQLKDKTDFCSFVYSNYRGEKARQALFTSLSSYKKVNAGGKYLNNIGGPVANKLAFESKHKFSIACENSSRSGYTTEKIIGAFMAQTIPIYWGDTDIDKQFNKKRFINCHDYDSFDDVLRRVKEIDNDDNLYLSIVNEPISIPEYDFSKIKLGLETFLQHIFDIPLSKAPQATINLNRLSEMILREKISAIFIKYRRLLIKIGSNLYRPFKHINFIEKIKYKLLK